MTAPARLETVYCTDEDIVAVARADFIALSAKSARLAYGTDGYFDEPTPWVLNSASVDFAANGVGSNHIVQLSRGSVKNAFPGGGELLAVDSSTATSLTLRWPGMEADIGHPPGYGGLTGVEFSVRTMAAQIEDACFDLNDRFGIDPNQSWRAPGNVYDLRVLRGLAVLAVLARAYTNEVRAERGDWKEKADHYRAEYADAVTRGNVRWGPRGVDPSPNIGWFRTRVTR